MYVEVLWSHDTSAHGLKGKKSRISHRNALLLLFSSRIVQKEKVVRCYYGFQFYAFMTKGWHETRTYGERV